jgi:hypothetical protein
LTRIYLPLNASMLRALSAAGALEGAPLSAHAVTDAVQAAAPNAGQDEWEYAVLNDAALSSGAMLDPGETRRIVAAADVSPDLVGPAPAGGSAVESAVSVTEPVPLRRIASLHVDGDAAAGDQWAEDEDLLWYDVTELPVVLDLL